MSVFSDSNVNKFVAVALIVVVMVTYVLSGMLHFALPPTMDTIIGIALGYAAHALGVVNGVASVSTASQNAASAAASTAAATAATMAATAATTTTPGSSSGGGNG